MRYVWALVVCLGLVGCGEEEESGGSAQQTAKIKARCEEAQKSVCRRVVECNGLTSGGEAITVEACAAALPQLIDSCVADALPKLGTVDDVTWAACNFVLGHAECADLCGHANVNPAACEGLTKDDPDGEPLQCIDPEAPDGGA